MEHKTRVLSTTYEEGDRSQRENPIRQVTDGKDDSLQRGSELTSHNASQNLVNYFSSLFLSFFPPFLWLGYSSLNLLSIASSLLSFKVLILCAADLGFLL